MMLSTFLTPVFLCLAGSELALQVEDRVVGGEDAVWRVELLVLAFLDVSVNDVGHVVGGDDGVVDLLVVLHAQGLHQGHERDLSRGRGHGHHEHAVALLLHQGQGAVPFLLREYLRDLQLGAVALVELDHDPVGRQVLEGDQDALRAADDEVSAGVHRVLAGLQQLLADTRPRAARAPPPCSP